MSSEPDKCPPLINTYLKHNSQAHGTHTLVFCAGRVHNSSNLLNTVFYGLSSSQIRVTLEFSNEFNLLAKYHKDDDD